MMEMTATRPEQYPVPERKTIKIVRRIRLYLCT